MTLFPWTIVLSQTYVLTDEDGTRSEWDVTLGLRLAERRGAHLLAFRPAEHGITAAHIRLRYPDLNEGYASALTLDDLARPLLFLPFKGKHLLVDGWHRLFRCVTATEGQAPACLPAYLLTEAEAEQIRLDGVPGVTAPIDTDDHEERKTRS